MAKLTQKRKTWRKRRWNRGGDVDHDQVIETKDAIKAAYKQLRRNGFVARSNFSCCMGCGCVEIAQKVEEKGGDPEKQKYVFYHRQDNESLKEFGCCHLAWGGPTDGEEIKEALQEAGLRVKWDGTKNNRFEVSLPVLTATQIDKLVDEIAEETA